MFNPHKNVYWVRSLPFSLFMYLKEKQYKITMILLCPVQGPWASSCCILLQMAGRNVTLMLKIAFSDLIAGGGMGGGLLLNSTKHIWYLRPVLPRVDRTYDPVENQKVNYLVIQKFYLNFAVFLSNFTITHIWINFIHYWMNILRRNNTFLHYS